MLWNGVVIVKAKEEGRGGYPPGYSRRRVGKKETRKGPGLMAGHLQPLWRTACFEWRGGCVVTAG